MNRENFKINFMKSKMTIFVVTLLLSTWSLTGNAQTTIPKGKAQIIEFNNSTAKFTVPAGKTWYIINLFSDCTTNLTYDSEGYLKADEIRIFIKSINGSIITDIANKKYGPVIYRGPMHERMQPLPIILPENSTIEFLVTSGDWQAKNKSAMTINNVLKAYLNIVEIDN